MKVDRTQLNFKNYIPTKTDIFNKVEIYDCSE